LIKSGVTTKPADEVRPDDEDTLRKLVHTKPLGGIVHSIQPLLVPEIVARCGMRWWNAEGNDIAAIVLRRVVIDNNLGGYGSSYDARRLKAPASRVRILIVVWRG